MWKSLAKGNVEVTGKRKREVGLIVAGRYTAYMKELRTAEVLIFEMNNKNEHYSF